MRHGNKVNNLNRKAAHRKAMLANMACSLIQHKRIKTTLAKAKALRIYVEPLITKAKIENNATIPQATHHRRTVFAYLKSKEAVTELFTTVADRVGERAGGYTRIIKLGTRLGDNAEVCIIELVDFNETYQKEEKTKKKSRRRRRGGKKSTEQQAQEEQVQEEKVEEKVEEVVQEEESSAEETTAEVVETETKEEEQVEATVEETPTEEVTVEVQEEKVATKEEEKEEAPSEEESKKDDEEEKKSEE